MLWLYIVILYYILLLRNGSYFYGNTRFMPLSLLLNAVQYIDWLLLLGYF